jgi:hypothetical protein
MRTHEIFMDLPKEAKFKGVRSIELINLAKEYISRIIKGRS